MKRKDAYCGLMKTITINTDKSLLNIDLIGIGHKLMEYIINLDFVKNSRGILTTKTAHNFYRDFGFSNENDIVKNRIMVKQPE